ncbi:endothelin-converting enzyme homolog [Gigantopelta aegis]|uniref:endothelin-converting enzyme homolog n=1 Tax=Gigantopelta aegis TaxID=1735272 RepID=UPI001B888F2F|nr:endothelin-converting enzyme homolog [Gigantopelta aegis]
MTGSMFNIMSDDEKPIIKTFRRLGIGLREIVIMALLIGLAVICIILAALLSVEKAKTKANASGPSSSAQTGNNGQFCLVPPCLKIAAHAMENMNTSVDPCDDFYQYACGNFANTHKVDAVNGLHSTLTDLEKNNERKVESLLLKPIDRYSESSSERKLKELYQSCMDEFSKERQKGKPVIDKIIPKMNGWYVFGNWKQAEFDINKALKTVQTDFLTTALFTPYPGYDYEDITKKRIEIYAGGISYNMPYFSYLDLSGSKEETDYKTFVRRVAKLLLRDASINITSDVNKRIDQFVEDIYHIEGKIVETDFNFINEDFPGGKLISLGELTKNTGSVIDWTVQIGSVFDKVAVTKDTLVYVDNMNYMMLMMQYIDGLDKAEMPRIMHNYLLWRTVERLLPELSSEYVYADREIYVDLNGYTQFQPRSDICLQGTLQTFPDSMGALFIADHFVEKNKNHVTDITNTLKTTFTEFISENTWMDYQTKKIATDKVNDMKILIGYPQFIADHNILDDMYKWFHINGSDYFQNILNINEVERRKWNEFMTSEDREKWYFNVFSADASYYHLLNQVTIPAGLLQFPVYDYDIPHYMTFGSIGSLTGRAILFATDVDGRQFDKNGRMITDSDTGFWSASTAKDFNDTVLNCMTKSTAKVTQGPFTDTDQSVHYIPISDRITRAMITNAAAVRFSLETYKQWKKQGKAKELRPLATNLNDEQMFFVSYAQTFCETFNDARGIEMASSYGIKSVRVNLELKQLDEFSQAFKCPPGSNMNPPNKCPLF